MSRSVCEERSVQAVSGNRRASVSAGSDRSVEGVIGLSVEISALSVEISAILINILIESPPPTKPCTARTSLPPHAASRPELTFAIANIARYSLPLRGR